MKKIIPFVIIVISLLSSLQTSAKIWRVNNNPSLDGDVLQASTLFDNTNNATNPEAANGDSVYLEPSSTAYNGFNVNKQVVIIGYGYFLNANTGFQANTNNAKTGNITFVAGSAGSSIAGVDVNVGSSGGQIIITNVGNITVTRCAMDYFAITGFNAAATGIRVDKCYIALQVYEQSMNAALATGAVVVNIENCIFSWVANSGTSGISVGQKIRGLLRNNTFNNSNSILCYNFYIANNIVVGNTDFGIITNSGNNVYRNNILSYPSNTQNNFVTNNGGTNLNNLFGQNMDPTFTGTTDNTFNGTTIFNNRINVTGTNLEARFDLETTANVATAGGESGTTFGAAAVTTPACGAYGATDPYRKGGFPAIPRISVLTVPATVSNGAATMNISVSSSSNN